MVGSAIVPQGEKVALGSQGEGLEGSDLIKDQKGGMRTREEEAMTEPEIDSNATQGGRLKRREIRTLSHFVKKEERAFLSI